MAVSLDSALPKASDVSKLAETRSAEQMEEDCAVWDTLRNEMEEAATRIQSNYRGYRTRQKLTRGDAVRAATTSTSDSGGSQDQTGVLHTGELHDAVLPPLPPKQNGS